MFATIAMHHTTHAVDPISWGSLTIACTAFVIVLTGCGALALLLRVPNAPFESFLRVRTGQMIGRTAFTLGLIALGAGLLRLPTIPLVIGALAAWFAVSWFEFRRAAYSLEAR